MKADGHVMSEHLKRSEPYDQIKGLILIERALAARAERQRLEAAAQREAVMVEAARFNLTRSKILFALRLGLGLIFILMTVSASGNDNGRR